MESNLAGPATPISLLGMPVRAIIPIGVLAGNLTIAFLALSYAGCLAITVQADTGSFPDLTPIVAAAHREWKTLCQTAGVPANAPDTREPIRGEGPGMDVGVPMHAPARGGNVVGGQDSSCTRR